MKLSKLFISTLAIALVGTFAVSCGNKTSGSSSVSSSTPASSTSSSTTSSSTPTPVVEKKGVATGLGTVISLASNDTAGITQINITTAAASFDEEGKVISVEFDVVQIPLKIVVEGETSKIVIDSSKKQVKDAGDKLVETKQELLERYGMKGSSEIGLEAYEQMRNFADYVEGKTIAQVIAHGYTNKGDGSHVYVPSQEEGKDLAGKVSITVNDYVAALMEAYETKNAYVQVEKTAVLSTGVGMVFEFNASSFQIDAYTASITLDQADKIQGAYVDTLQVPLKLVDGKVALNATAKQVKEAGYKVMETKKELGARYGMYYQSAVNGVDGAYKVNPNATAEWFEQAKSLENWLIGQAKTALDFADAEFGEGHALASKVTITVDGYFSVLKEAATYAKALPTPAA
jgi:hypothetical protein